MDKSKLRIDQWPPRDKSGKVGNDPGVAYKLWKKPIETLVRLFYRPKHINLKYLNHLYERGKGFILVSNHDSGMDPFYFTFKFKSKFHAIAVDNHYWDNPIVRKALTDLGVIAVPEDGSGGATLYSSLQALKYDFALMIFPEGNFRHWKRKIYGRTGAAVLGAITGKAIIPIGIRGVDWVYLKDYMIPLNRKITVEFCPPRYVKEEYRIKEGEELEPEVARGITDELMYDIRRASHYAGLLPEHREELLRYYKDFKTDIYTYQDPDVL